jgi:hypothetical protein
VAVNSSGLVVPASDTSGLSVVGRSDDSKDNTGPLYAATRPIAVHRGCFLWENGGSFTDADIGQLCYVADDQTVTTAAAASNDIIAGWIVDVDSDGVWVDSRDLGSQGASSVTTLATSGNGSIGGTLAVTGAATLSSTLSVSGAATMRIPVMTVVTEATTNRVCTSADYGKVIIVATNAAVAITLPANGAAAGSWIGVMVKGSDDCAPTIAAATQDTLVGPNDVDLDSVTWGTGHRIGAFARFISDGTSWHVLNLGGTTMTYTD